VVFPYLLNAKEAPELPIGEGQALTIKTDCCLMQVDEFLMDNVQTVTAAVHFRNASDEVSAFLDDDVAIDGSGCLC
jgi:hypothetical protein